MFVLAWSSFLIACGLTKDISDTTVSDSETSVSSTGDSDDYVIPEGVAPGECLYRVYFRGGGPEDEELWSIWSIDGLLLEVRYGPALMGDDEWWFSYAYDADDRLVAEEEHQRENGETVDRYSVGRIYVYGSDGLVVSETIDTDIDGVTDYTISRTYDAEERLTWMGLIDEQEGLLIEETLYTYDVVGSTQMTTVEEYDTVEGVLTKLTVTVEDVDAMSVSVVTDSDGDGLYDVSEEWEYNSYGDRVAYYEDRNADGSVDYQYDAEYSYNDLGQTLEVFYDYGDGTGAIDRYTYTSTNHIDASEYYDLAGEEMILDYRLTRDYSACDLTSICILNTSDSPDERSSIDLG